MADGSGPARTIDIRLLGDVQALAADGSALDVGPAKCQLVLAVLALNVGRPVPVPRIVDAVWGEDPPRTAERTLQSYLARLRGVLGQDSIARVPGAYRLTLPPESVDVARFESLVSEGDLDGALAAWTGEPFGGLDSPGLEPARVELMERWLAVVEADLETRVESDPAACVGQLSSLTATYPFREGLWALLMTALYRVGRQADALAAYRAARDGLTDLLGVEPGHRLQDLHASILRQDPALSRPIATSRKQAQSIPSGTVTFAFAELDDAPALWSRAGTEMAAATVDHHARVKDISEQYGGSVFTHVGDAYGVAFSSAERAAEWARAIHDLDGTPVEGHGLQYRVALHTGEAQEHQGTYFGPAAHLASRMAAVGHGGQTLASETSAGLIPGSHLDLGRWSLDDVTAEVRIFQVGAGEYPPLRAEDRHRGNLPRRLNPLFGRDDEQERVLAALESHRLVTLAGPGGIGKTSLALAVARRQAPRDGWLVDFATVGAPTDVPRAVAELLGVKERQGAELTHSLVESLRSRSALLVLDNCEHLVDAVADLATQVLANCPEVRILATSRERLGITHERVISVPTLAPDAAALLFAARAASVDETFDLAAHRAAVGEICERLDGIPLAIELASGRAASMDIEDLQERLRSRMQVLDGTRRSGAARHRTLWSAIAWSYDLLAPEERAVFRRLSAFTGPFDLAAAEWVAGVEGDENVANALGRLVDQSLITVDSGPRGRRFRLLQPIREFGRERLEEVGTAELMAERHARWCWCEVTGIHEALGGWKEGEAVARLAELWPNLRSAFEWARARGRWDLARNLMEPILSEVVVRSRNELGDWAERLLASAPPDDLDSRILGLVTVAHRYSMTHDPEAYEQLANRYGEPDHVLVHHARAIATEDHEAMLCWAPLAAEEYLERGDTLLAQRAEINVAAAWLNLGQLERADDLLDRLIERFRLHGPPTFVSWALFLRGYSALFQEDSAAADACFAEGVDIDLPPRTHAPTEPLKARAAFRRGDRARAFRILRDHIDELLDADNMQAAMMDCIEFVSMMAAIGRTTQAAVVLGHLESGHLLDGPGWRLLVADAMTVLDGDRGPGLPDDRAALEFMRSTLEEFLVAEGDGRF